MDVFSAWFDHGRSPDSASYQYIVVPDVTEQELWETSKNNRSIEIHANNSTVQAVTNMRQNISQIAFYSAGNVNVSNSLNVRMDGPGMAMLKKNKEKVSELTVADPSRKSSRLIITLSGTYEGSGEDFVTVPCREENSTMIIVDLPQGVYSGKSVTVNLE